MVYERVKKNTSSWNPAFHQEKSQSLFKPRPFSIQPEADTEESETQEIPAYSRADRDAISAKLLKTMGGDVQSQAETESQKPESESEGLESDEVSPEAETLQRQEESPETGADDDISSNGDHKQRNQFQPKEEELEPLQAQKNSQHAPEVSQNKEQHLQAMGQGIFLPQQKNKPKSRERHEWLAQELTDIGQQSGGAVQAKLDTSHPEQADELTSKPQAETSESTQAVELILVEVIESLQTDPEDSSGQVRRRLKSLEPSSQKVVMVQLQQRLPPEPWQRLHVILAEPASSEGEESLPFSQHEELAPETEAASDNRVGDREEASSASSGESDTRSSQAEPDDARKQDIPDHNTPPAQASPEVTSEAAESKTAPPSADASESITGTAQTDQSASKIPQEATEEGTIPEQQIAEPPGNAESITDGSSTSTPPSMSAGEANASKQTVTNASSAESSSAGLVSTQNNSLPNAQVQTPSTNFAGTQTLLDQVTAAANTARQRFTERITQGTEAIATSVQQQQAALIAAGEQQTGAIQALFANARAQVGEIITSANAQLQTDATSHLASLEQGHTATLGQVATTFSSGQERVQTLGNTYAERSLQTADESAQQVQTRIQGMAQESRSIGQEKAQVGGSTPEIAQAKAKAANEIASDTATKITSGVSDAMRDLRATGPETASGFREQSQEAALQVGAGQAEVVNQLNTSNQQTGSGIQQAVTQGSQALGNLGTQLTGQLASLEQTIKNQLQTQIAQKSQEIYQAGQQAITTFQQQGQQAIASGDEHLAQFNQQLAGMDVDPELATQVGGEITGQVNGAYDSLIATTDGAFQQADGALTQAGTEVINAINAISTNAAGQIQSFLGQAQGQVTQQVGTISGQLGNTVSKANAADSSMVSQVTSSLDGQLGQIDSAFGQGLQQYQGALNEQVTSVGEQAREPRESLPGRVEEGQQRVEERAQRSWIENQLNDIVEMFSWELLAGLIVGLLVGAFVIGTFGTGAAVLIAAGAIAGAAGALASTVVGNARAGRALGDNVVENMILGAFGGAVGAAALIFLGGGFIAGGAIGGFAAGLGLGTGGTIALLVGGASVTAGILTVVDNWLRGEKDLTKGLVGNMLLAGVLTWLGIKVARRSGNTPPVEEPPVRPPVEETPVRPPVEEPPGRRPSQGCFVAGTKVLTPQGEKNIESLIVGDKVCALDTSSKEERVQLVECAFIRSVPTVLDIQIGETSITCSPEHPFWVPQQGWLKAKELQIGSTLFSLYQGDVTVEHIQIRTGTFTVYNIEVNGLHNYCVSPLGILVHNKAMRWNLQDRAAALRARVTELLEQVRDFPEDVPERAELLRQLQEAEPEANRLARLAEESDSPDALESSLGAIESLEEQLIRLEESAGAASLPLRARSLPHRVRQLMERANELPDIAEKYELITRLKSLKGEAEAIRDLADDAGSIESEIVQIEAELRGIERRIGELDPATPTEVTVPRPHLSNPANSLPTGGDHPYVPPRQPGSPEIVRWTRGGEGRYRVGGFEDIHGNRWEWAHDQHAGPHWDVQHPDGSHTNVYPDGMVHQGADNF